MCGTVDWIEYTPVPSYLHLDNSDDISILQSEVHRLEARAKQQIIANIAQTGGEI